MRSILLIRSRAIGDMSCIDLSLHKPELGDNLRLGFLVTILVFRFGVQIAFLLWQFLMMVGMCRFS